MTCSTCGAALPEGAKFCGVCGTTQAAPAPAPAPVEAAPVYQEPAAAPVYQEQPAYQAPPAYQPQPAYQVPPAPVYQQPAYQPQPEPAYQPQPAPQPAPAEPAPPKGSLYAPISTLGYFGYFILFAIPIIGQILCIAFAFSKKGNVNRRNLAKAMFVMLIIGLVLSLAIGIPAAVAAKQITNGEIPGWMQGIPGLSGGEGIGSGFPFSFGGGGSEEPYGGGTPTPQGSSSNPSGGSGGGSGGSSQEEFSNALNQLGQMFGSGWPENEFTKQVPKPKFETTLVPGDEDGCGFLASASLEQLQDYVKELQRAGFNKDADTTNESMFGLTVYSYTASNGKGYRVEVNSSMGVSAISISKEYSGG